MIRRLDSLGVALMLGIAAAFAGGGAALISWHIVTLTELVAVPVVGTVLVFGYRPRSASSSYNNTFAHGAARLSSEAETHAASTGSGKAADLHQQTFSD